MGKKKYQEQVAELFKKSPVVGYKSIERIVKSRSNSEQYAKQLIRNLVLSKKIKRLAKGVYTIYNDASLAVFCFKGYLGLQDALSIYNLWEQETIPIIITTKKIRQGIRNIIGSNVLIRKLDKKYFFGFDYIKHEDFYLPYSDIEKTFIDLIYFRQKIDKETLENIKGKINREKLRKYLKIYPKRISKKILKVLN
ncbi:MAG: hypothetical protein AABY32_03340 [Nanoarchaeota archaeon]